MSNTPSLTVHIRVNDSTSGRPTPCRLRVASLREDGHGDYFAPFGRIAQFPGGRNEDVGGQVCLNGKRYAYIDGSCEIRLPTGVPLAIEITKGPEYEPLRETVTLGAGKMALRFALRRWVDLRAEGWLSADCRCHFLSPHAALLEAAAEDLGFAHLLAVEHEIAGRDGRRYRSVGPMTAFSGQAAALESGGHAVIVNTLNVHPMLGHLGLLHCHRPVYPLSFGQFGEPDDWSLADWCEQCHRKKGLVVWSNAFRTEAALPGGEALIALLLGKVDAVEIDAANVLLLPTWYRLLDAGVEVPLVGAGGKESNNIALGSLRTYTRMAGESQGLNDWVEQTRLGRTVVTNGPLIDLRVNGQPVGSRISTADPEKRLAVEASVRSIVPFDKLEVIANGAVVAEATPNGSPPAARIETELCLSEGGWIAARCRGAADSELYSNAAVMAHSSPIYVRIENKPIRTVAEATRSLRGMVEQTRAWVETEGRFEHEKSKQHLLGLCAEALSVLARREAQATEG